MRKVYIVTGHVQYEADWIVQVHATRELAEIQAEEFNRDGKYEDYAVEEWEVLGAKY